MVNNSQCIKLNFNMQLINQSLILNCTVDPNLSDRKLSQPSKKRTVSSQPIELMIKTFSPNQVEL